jgi:uncharacterized repeat protein (TIGR04052 family)
MNFVSRIGLGVSMFGMFVWACSDGANTTPAQDAGAQRDAQATLDGSTDATLQGSPVELLFEAKVGSEPFACGKTYQGVGTTNAEATAGDLRFFIHDVKLTRGAEEVPLTLDDRGPWQNARLALVDFEDNTAECEFGTPGTNNKVTGKAAGAGFDGVTFTIGVPEDLNHLNKDTQMEPLVGSGMNWNWTTGYIHFASQLNPTAMVGGARAPAFYAHIGSSVCAGNPADGGTPGCMRKNRPVVTLKGFDPTKQKIVVDLKKLYVASDINTNTPATISGCMSGPMDPECGPLFGAMGLNFDTGAVAGPSTLFSVETR